MIAVRAQLARCLEETRALRARIGSVPPNAWTLSENPQEPWPVDDAGEALHRVVELATNWTHIPSRCHAGRSVLEAVRGTRAEPARV